MSRLTDLRTLFTAVAVLELSYFVATMMPPDLLGPLTGWDLSADGHWIAKILGVALLAQAGVAWIFRREPHLGVAKVLAAYQVGSATVDWVMWLVMSDRGIFGNALAQTSVIAAIVSHYLLGLLLFLGIRRHAAAARA